MSGETSSRQKSSVEGQQSCKSEIDPPDESPFTCPICLTWLKEPMLTSCGHRFCKLCIESWLERESSCCPVDNIPLRKDKDIFPDNYTRREISQQMTVCSNSHLGCEVELSLAEMESHIPTCSFNEKKSASIDCSFKPFGCHFKSKDLQEINKHNIESTQNHLTLLSTAYSSISINGVNSKTEEAKLWDAPSKSSQNSAPADKLHDLVRGMYERIIILEQRTSEQDITIRNLRKQLNDIQIKNEHIVEDTLLQFCGGVYVWKINDFVSKFKIMKEDNHKMFYSQGFYTSAHGYRFCGRINLSPKNPEFLALLVHVMQSNHDNCLDWPFNGKISLTICHPVHSAFNIKETMMTRPDLEAFQKPNGLMNQLGFGYTEFISLEELINKGFTEQNNLTIKIQIQTV